MTTEITAKTTPRQRALHELKELEIVAVYLYITFGAVILMKTAVLHDQGINFVPWGIAAVKSLLLAKFILLGRAMKIGERYTARPLIWPTLHKAFAFLVLLVVLVIIEEVAVGLFGRRLARRTLWRQALRDPRRHSHHAAGAHSVFRFPRSRRGARRRDADEDVLCRAAADGAEVR